MDLVTRFRRRCGTVGVIGLGYVGLPLAVAFAEAGFFVTGIDLDPLRVGALTRGESYIDDVSVDRLRPLMERGALRVTTAYAAISRCDAVLICVPTPLNMLGDPDVSHIVAATEAMVPHLHAGMLIALASTTYPGTTSELVLPILSANESLLRVGHEFFLAYSPERVDPGRTDWTTENTPRVIGGITTQCREVALACYRAAFQHLVPVSSTSAAEMVKLLENTFRAINIGLANEVLVMCDKLQLDAWEVIEAAATKPFGFMRFDPGPGLGGHCLPIDPLYLSWRLKRLDYRARFIEVAAEINTGMPGYWVQKVQDALNDRRMPLKGSRILVLGVTYKPNVRDMRESPAIDILRLLFEKGADTTYHDPLVPAFEQSGLEMVSVPDLDAALAGCDCALLVTDHSSYDAEALRARVPLLLDTRHPVRSGGTGGESNAVHPTHPTGAALPRLS